MPQTQIRDCGRMRLQQRDCHVFSAVGSSRRQAPSPVKCTCSWACLLDQETMVSRAGPSVLWHETLLMQPLSSQASSLRLCFPWGSGSFLGPFWLPCSASHPANLEVPCQGRHCVPGGMGSSEKTLGSLHHSLDSIHSAWLHPPYAASSTPEDPRCCRKEILRKGQFGATPTTVRDEK